MKIVKGKTILHNTVTDYVFLASDIDEKTQLSADSHKHIVYIGELSRAINEPYNPIPSNPEQDASFRSKLQELINSHSKENGSNTPDYILVDYLTACLNNFNTTVMRRSAWYGFVDRIGGAEISESKGVSI